MCGLNDAVATEMPAAAPWLIYSDGSAMPNPGRMAIGAVITAPDGTRHTLSLPIQATGCNNEAELRALMAALHESKKQGATQIVAYSDNSVLVEQLGSAPTRPIARLAALFDEARNLLASFDDTTVKWIPRHRNGEADALARAALGMLPRTGKLAKKRQR